MAKPTITQQKCCVINLTKVLAGVRTKLIHIGIASKPAIGDPKVGDLDGIFVYKFKLVDKQWLLAYRVVSAKKLKLLLIGPHENFYRELKKSN